MKYNKVPLSFDSYAIYEIPQDYLAWVVEVSDVDQNRIDDIEYELQTTGHKIFHTEATRSQAGNLFNVKIIIAKSEMTF